MKWRGTGRENDNQDVVCVKESIFNMKEKIKDKKSRKTKRKERRNKSRKAGRFQCLEGYVLSVICSFSCYRIITLSFQLPRTRANVDLSATQSLKVP